MMALRLPFISRQMILDLRVEKIYPRDRIPALVTEPYLLDLHQRAIARKDLQKTQYEWDLRKIYSGSMMLR